LALQPIATALFANSPFVEGKPSGFLSSRADVWTDVDNQRSGMPPAFFSEGFGFERYVDWLLDVPMYFIVRDGQMIDVAGLPFRQFMAEGLKGLPGFHATMGDFEDHMTTAFTDVRVKRFLEMRGADAGRPDMMVAQSAFWVGLLYDDTALLAAEALVRRRPWADYLALRAAVPRLALDAPFGDGTARDVAKEAVSIALSGLQARSLHNAAGDDERIHLDPLMPMIDGGPTQAEHWLGRYHSAWDGDASRIFAESHV
jgi:glutamate--cysteine ligase